MGDLQRLDRNQPYGSLSFPNLDERIMTRLGEEGVVLTIDSSPQGPFGNPITRITLPARWSAGISSDDVEAVQVHSVPDGLMFTVGDRPFKYSRLGLQSSE